MTAKGYPTLEEHLSRLREWLAGLPGRDSDFQSCLLIESNDWYALREGQSFWEKLPIRPRRLPRASFFTPEEFQQRYSQLMESGYAWLHFAAKCKVEGCLIVSVAHPAESGGTPGEFVALNMAGANDGDWNARWCFV